MQQLPSLIRYEEIYDLDVERLEEIQMNIKSQNTDDVQWNKKAKKILDLIDVELKERLAIQNFASNIQFQDFIQQPIYQNNALQSILNDIKQRPANYLDQQYSKPPLPRYEQSKQEQQPQQSKQLYQQSYQKVSQQKSCQSDAMSLSTVTRSSNANTRLQAKKPNQMLEMMKEVLKKTEVCITESQNQYAIPPPPKPQLSTVEKIKQEKQLRKKKKKKTKLENNKSSQDHLPEINQQKNIPKQSTQQKMEASNMHSQTPNIFKSAIENKNIIQYEEGDKESQQIKQFTNAKQQINNNSQVSQKSANKQQIDYNDKTKLLEENEFLENQQYTSSVKIQQGQVSQITNSNNDVREHKELQHKSHPIDKIDDANNAQSQKIPSIAKNQSQERIKYQQNKSQQQIIQIEQNNTTQTLIQTNLPDSSKNSLGQAQELNTLKRTSIQSHQTKKTQEDLDTVIITQKQTQNQIESQNKKLEEKNTQIFEQNFQPNSQNQINNNEDSQDCYNEDSFQSEDEIKQIDEGKIIQNSNSNNNQQVIPQTQEQITKPEQQQMVKKPIKPVQPVQQKDQKLKQNEKINKNVPQKQEIKKNPTNQSNHKVVEQIKGDEGMVVYQNFPIILLILFRNN